MARAEVKYRRGGLEEIVEKPLKNFPISHQPIAIHVPSFGTQAGGLLGSSGAAGGVPANGFRILAVPNRNYFAWVVKQGWSGRADVFYNDEYGGVRGFVSGIIKADIDKVALYEQSPTLKSMAEALKNALYGYEFAMTFTLTKLPLDALLATLNLIEGKRKPLLKGFYKNYAKAHGTAAIVDGILFMLVYGTKEYMLHKVAEIIQSPAGTYPSKEAAIEAVKNMIYNQYFPFVNGPMKTTGDFLMIAVPLASIGAHLYLVWRASKKNNELIEGIREAVSR